MPVLLYLHGFLSSPQSAKAKQAQRWLVACHPEVEYRCPLLPSYPAQARQLLEREMASLNGKQVGIIGSSLGGFWATYLAEKYALRAVLVNPAVRPQDRFGEFVGKTLKNYHSQDECHLTEQDLQELVAADISRITLPERYWVMLQTGDETLDYKLAEAKYRGSKMLIEEGGDHGFQGFEKWLPDIKAFLFS